MTPAQALEFAEQHFPHAPERLAEYLGIHIHYSPLNGDCDGWCLQFGNRSVIRINSKLPQVRQRFTLAHELGHLVYGVATVVGESVTPFGKKSSEEKEIDSFAAQLLLPTSEVTKAIKETPVTEKLLTKLAKKAQVSPLAVALRVAGLATKIGLIAASVVLYENDNLAWQWPGELRVTRDILSAILAKYATCAPSPARISQPENKALVAFVLSNPYLQTKTLFIQLTDAADGFRQLREERIKELEATVFAGEGQYKRSFEGCIGSIKPKIENLPLAAAITMFSERYLKDPERWGTSQFNRLRTAQGSEYIRLRLQSWTVD